MNLSELFLIYLGVLAPILGATQLLRRGEALRQETKESIQKLLIASPGDWISNTNGLFLHIFDRFYCTRPTSFKVAQGSQIREPSSVNQQPETDSERIFWYGIKASIAIVTCITLTLYLSGIITVSSEVILIIALALASVLTLLAVGMVGIMDWGRASLPVPDRGLSGIPRKYVIKLIAGVIGLIFGAVIFTVIGGAIGGGWNSIAWVVITGIFLLVVSIPGLYLVPRYLPIKPVNAIVTSLLAISILAVIRNDAALSFWREFNSVGPVILSFIAFNLFADVVSLWETRWILQKSKAKGLQGNRILGSEDLEQVVFTPGRLETLGLYSDLTGLLPAQ